MPNPVPTRQTLCHLRRICAAETIATTSKRTRHTEFLGQAAPSDFWGTYRQQRLSHRAFSTTPTRTRAQESQSTSSNTPPAPSLPDITTYYTLFPSTLPSGPPPNGPFTIPHSALRREFLQLQAQHHPDKYTGSAVAHEKSHALSSLLNTAYKTLSDPLLRARYLLQHNYGIDIMSEDNNTHRGVTDQATLMEVMDAQEAIEEAETQGQIDALKAENRARISETEKRLGEAFEQEDVEAAKVECVRLNYWRSLQQGLDDWEPGKEVKLIH
ncbi:Fe-S protein assembly co-chaperone HscB [Rhinocladiella mackenziei CBS 650.93]|uniref:Fe-S protein assembly co-chaperone HscB n=1 Tax=Rhinocladiella mackenziei CBS 650.93 TaxID=1442369 RepID=A0A0D2I0W1_9EURO|nr:Fe-S protein assembly co-chaperone HscB [Rhinocladiella mackenziei CBS 650.93]KIW99363.1 Fe-S protein assembly co-chaperone HscB [Rhinocladiella mackenziei CBS 650.93]